jgi:hypothetical protein
VLCKHGTRVPGAVLVLINKDWHEPQTTTLPAKIGTFLPDRLKQVRPCRGEAPTDLPEGKTAYLLDPAEIVLLFDVK